MDNLNELKKERVNTFEVIPVLSPHPSEILLKLAFVLVPYLKYLISFLIKFNIVNNVIYRPVCT